jgi:hypothetical protein
VSGGLQPRLHHPLGEAADELAADDAAGARDGVGIAVVPPHLSPGQLHHPGDAAAVEVRGGAGAAGLHEEAEPPLVQDAVEGAAGLGAEGEIDDVVHDAISRVDRAIDPFSGPAA